MATRMFVNLPVKNLKRSIDFFARLGYEFEPHFTDENAACVILGPENYAMLLVEKFFAGFTPKSKSVVDAERGTEVLIALSADSRDAVNAIVDKALAAGGRKAREPEDYGFMYGRSFQDPDGHIWEHFWMDPEYLAKPGRYGKLEFAASGDRELILKRELDAPRGRVFEAFTRPELLLRWLSGPPGWTMSVCRVDPRVGGSYRFEWREERGSGGMAVGGTFREVTAPERFVATERFDQPWYPGEAELEYSFAEKEGKTAITVTVRYESQEARDVVLRSDMPRGLAWCYNQLAMLLAG